jgi:glycerate kinase
MIGYGAILAQTFAIDIAAPGRRGWRAWRRAHGNRRKAYARHRRVLDLKNFDEELVGADLVVTGEGRFDSQSLGFGKVISGILSRAEKKNVPVAVVAGSVLDGIDALYGHRAGIMPCVDRPMPLSQAMKDAAPMLEAAAARMFSLISLW